MCIQRKSKITKREIKGIEQGRIFCYVSLFISKVVQELNNLHKLLPEGGVANLQLREEVNREIWKNIRMKEIILAQNP